MSLPNRHHDWLVTFDASLWAYRNSLKVGFQTALDGAAAVVGTCAGTRVLFIDAVVALSTSWAGYRACRIGATTIRSDCFMVCPMLVNTSYLQYPAECLLISKVTHSYT